MADEADEAGTTEPAQEKQVPYERFAEVNKAARAAQAELAAAQKRLREIEEAELSASEREKGRADRAEARAAELEGEVTKAQRRNLITEAARQAKFHDPSDALQIDPSGIETEADARRAVLALAKIKAHLVAEAAPPPELGRVLDNGNPIEAESAAAQRHQAHGQLNQHMREMAGVPADT